jgi:hypothetical protein
MLTRIGSQRLRVVPWLTLCAAALAVAGCAQQPVPSAGHLPGFWWGLLHGFIMPFTLFGELFSDVRIYAFPNSGGWYDFGYFIGAAAVLGESNSRARSAAHASPAST